MHRAAKSINVFSDTVQPSPKSLRHFKGQGCVIFYEKLHMLVRYNRVIHKQGKILLKNEYV